VAIPKQIRLPKEKFENSHFCLKFGGKTEKRLFSRYHEPQRLLMSIFDQYSFYFNWNLLSRHWRTFSPKIIVFWFDSDVLWIRKVWLFFISPFCRTLCKREWHPSLPQTSWKHRTWFNRRARSLFPKHSSSEEIPQVWAHLDVFSMRNYVSEQIKPRF